MNQTISPTVLFVPGLRDHVADHWQTRCANALPTSRTVPPLEADKLSCAARVEALQAALQAIDGPVLLAAHSAGVMITVHWARKYGHTRRIHGALLAAPADLESPLPEGYPAIAAIEANGWLPVPRAALPFPSILAASTNDPLGSFERVEAMARDWGSRLVNIGAVGHLNPAAGFGEWPQALTLLRQLSTAPATETAP